MLTETQPEKTAGQVAAAAPRPRKKRRARATLVALAVAIVAAGGYLAWSKWIAPADAAAQYATTAVQRGDLEDVVTATGTLQPRDFVDVGTQVSGQIRKLHVDVGAVVKQGDLLAEIDPTVFKSRVDADLAQLANLRAQLADREAQRVLAEQQFQRQQQLTRENATSADAVQTAAANLQSATAQIAALRAQIQQVESQLRGDEANLGYTRIYAPMTGTVVSQAAKQGQTLNANQQAPIILRIADLSTMTVQTQVSEADVSNLRVGMDVYFTTLGNERRRYYGKLRQINPTPEVVNNVVLYDALFDVPNPSGELMTQMTAQVFFVLASAKNALLVPISALEPLPGSGERRRGARSGAGTTPRVAPDPRTRFAGKEALVRVLNDQGVVEERKVQVGATNRVAAAIISGLEPGERVVTGMRSGERSVPTGRMPRTPRL
ncbi:MAG: efflux RND transporter periplasmic adaptor subunit [Betaproteobacteria bacterium]|jgi:macrolide-specific efflux system membrane fusion protein|nr:efflux RND transporter periplasmic adaptor subunit [Betaproteobacteria bacterium]